MLLFVNVGQKLLENTKEKKDENESEMDQSWVFSSCTQCEWHIDVYKPSLAQAGKHTKNHHHHHLYDAMTQMN